MFVFDAYQGSSTNTSIGESRVFLFNTGARAMGKKAEYNIDKLRQEFAALRKYAAMDNVSQDVIGIKKIYIDMTGDIKAAMVLDELIFWTLPRENKMSGLRVWKDGVLWLAVGRSEWWDRKRLTERQADTAIKKLLEQNIIIKDVFRFNNSPTMHLRLNVSIFFEKYAETLIKLHPPEIEEDTTEKQLKDLHEMMGFPFSPNGNLQNGETDLQNGETDLQNGENINIPDSSLTQPSQKRGDLVDGIIELSRMPGVKKQVRLEGIQSRIAVALNINVTWSRWERFIRHADKQEQEQGETVEKFLEWLKSKPGFDISYWPPDKMQEIWPQAFNQDDDLYFFGNRAHAL
jgi:hypothetical protein